MGFLDFFKNFGSKADQDKARQDVNKALTELDVDVAIGAHKNWKNRLTSYLEGKSSEISVQRCPGSGSCPLRGDTGRRPRGRSQRRGAVLIDGIACTPAT